VAAYPPFDAEGRLVHGRAGFVVKREDGLVTCGEAVGKEARASRRNEWFGLQAGECVGLLVEDGVAPYSLVNLQLTLPVMPVRHG